VRIFAAGLGPHLLVSEQTEESLVVAASRTYDVEFLLEIPGKNV
jgi:hypothetical protein